MNDGHIEGVILIQSSVNNVWKFWPYGEKEQVKAYSSLE